MKKKYVIYVKKYLKKHYNILIIFNKNGKSKKSDDIKDFNEMEGS